MTEIVVLVVLLIMLLFGTLSQGSGDLNDQWSRVSWTGIGCGLLLAVAAPNPFSALLIAIAVLGLLWHPPMSVVYREKVSQGLVLAGVYVVMAPLMKAWMVMPILALFGFVGSVVGCWAVYSSFQKIDQGYEHVYLRGWLRIVDRDGGAPLAGQGNFNHAQSLGALSAAAGTGVWLFQHWWGLPVLLLSVLAVLLSSEGRMTGKWVSQGWVHLGVLGLGVLSASISSPWGWICISILLVGCCMWARPWSPRPGWYDSGRFAIWNLALREIWWRANQPRDAVGALKAARAEREQMEATQAKAAVEGNALVHNQMTVAKGQNDVQQQRWAVLAKQQEGQPLTAEEKKLAWRLWAQRVRVRLVGCGTGSWYPMTKWPAILTTGKMNEEKQVWEGMVYLSAHNELVEVWFELGLLGLAAALGFVYYGLTVTWGTPLFPLVCVLISVSLLNFPFTLFAEVERPTPATPVQFVGSPALLVMSLVTLLLVEAVR
jgi:hypothetical protein